VAAGPCSPSSPSPHPTAHQCLGAGLAAAAGAAGFAAAQAAFGASALAAGAAGLAAAAAGLAAAAAGLAAAGFAWSPPAIF
jgi:hypothetical protein